jgi:putative N6-adenine-specific DNA methylase
MTHHFFAPCPRGLESALADELGQLGAQAASVTDGGVAFGGDDRVLCRANLESRLASRVLLRVGEGSYHGEEDIYRLALGLPWPTLFDGKRSIRIALAAVRSPLRSLDFVTLRVKDAVCDAFRAATGARPNVDTRNPDVRIHVFLDQQRASIYLDTSGDPLFKRGWRTHVVDAPLRENLAAGILRIAGWRPGTPLLDPMCGGGTFLLEAATAALGIVPGANRGFGFERLSLYNAQLWHEVREAAEAKRTGAAQLTIFGSDRDPRAIGATRDALRRAGLNGVIELQRANILEIDPPAAAGVMVMNPPYGVRIGEQAELAELYPKLGDRLKRHFAGWRCFIFTADTRLPKLIGLKPARRTPLYNGALECRLYEFAIVAGGMRPRRSDNFQ